MNKTLEDIKSEVHLMLQDLTHNELKDYFSNLIYGYDKLQQRIDKAIDYINKNNFWGLYEDTPMIDVKYGEDLLKILKGDSNE